MAHPSVIIMFFYNGFEIFNSLFNFLFLMSYIFIFILLLLIKKLQYLGIKKIRSIS